MTLHNPQNSNLWTPQPYLGQVATRCRQAHNFFDTSTEAMCRSSHFARDNITSLQVIWTNWYCEANQELLTGGTMTLTGSVEYPVQSSATWTDTSTTTGTTAAEYVNLFGAPALAFSASGVVITNAYNTYFSAPTAGTNATLTNSWGLGADSENISGVLKVGGVIINPGIIADTGITDASVCVSTTTQQYYSGTGTLGICLGTSSARYKHEITPITVGLTQILKLKPVSFYLDKEHGDPKKRMYGFIAEDMQSVLPVLVGLDAHNRANTADYIGVIPVLVKAIQQQQKEITELKMKLEMHSK